MRTRTTLLLVVIVLIVAFAAINWGAFTSPTTLNLGFTTLEAPLGVVMLGLLAIVTLAFAVYMALWQGAILLETRRHAKELQSQRALADQAEASRFTELRGTLQAEFVRLNERIAASQAAVGVEIRDSANSLAAMIGEIDDRMKRRGRDDLA